MTMTVYPLLNHPSTMCEVAESSVSHFKQDVCDPELEDVVCRA